MSTRRNGAFRPLFFMFSEMNYCSNKSTMANRLILVGEVGSGGGRGNVVRKRDVRNASRRRSGGFINLSVLKSILYHLVASER